MPKTIINRNTADTYTDQGGANINSVYESRGGWVTLAATVFAQIQHSPQGAQQGQEQWSEEFVLPSGAHYLQPGLIGIRFRSFTAGNPVAVSAAIFFKDEPAMQLGGSGISTPGTNVASLNFQHNDIAVATEPTADFEDGTAVLTWSIVDDAPNTRVKITPSFPNSVIFPGSIDTGGRAVSTAVGSALGEELGGVGYVFLSRTAVNPTIVITAPGDTTAYRWQVDTNGAMAWAPGNAAIDCTFKRLTAGVLGSTDTSFSTGPTASGSHAVSGLFLQSGSSTGGGIWSNGSNASFTFLESSVTGETNARLNVQTGGQIAWGPGGAVALDTLLHRVNISQLGLNNKLLEIMQVWSNVTVPATLTPDLSLGLVQYQGITAGGANTLTIAAPLHPPPGSNTCMMIIRLVNAGGGTVTLSWNAVFKASQIVALPASLLNGQSNDTLWYWDALTGNWRIVLAA